jgi:hypothetical protein
MPRRPEGGAHVSWQEMTAQWAVVRLSGVVTRPGSQLSTTMVGQEVVLEQSVMGEGPPFG